MGNKEIKNNVKDKNKDEIRLFLSITIVLSVILEGLIICTGQMFYAAFLVWTPAFAAWITKFIYFPKEKNSLLFRKCKIKYILLALVLPFIYLSIPYFIYWIMNPSSMQKVWNLKLIPMAVVGILTGMVTTLGEEIGWRGFLVPRLVTWIGVKKTLLLSGLFWGAWHLPLLLAGLYLPDLPIWYKVPMFMIVITAVGVIIGILTLRSKSVWPAVLMHTAHNNFDQNMLELGNMGHNQLYFVSEAGMITAVIVVIMVIWMYRRYAHNMEL